MTKKGPAILLLIVSLLLTLTPASALTLISPNDPSIPPLSTGKPSGDAISIIRPVSPTGITYHNAFPFHPAPGHEQDPSAVSFANLNNLIWFLWIMQEKDEFVLPYTDVPEDSWFYPAVCYVYQQSLMNGVSDTSFAPYELVPRGLAWSVLARMNSVNTYPAPGQEWYEPGQTWAVAHGVTDGSGPLDPVTREQWVSMLWRRAGEPTVGTDLSVYPDGASVSDYAQNAMRWAVSLGIVPSSSGQLSPQAPLSRAELASMVLGLVPPKR